MTLEVESRGPILVVSVDRPEVRNAIDAETSLALRDVFRSFAADRDHRVAVLTGKGADFSAGGDLRPASREAARRVPKDVPWGGITRDFECDKPIVAAVHGNCLGGGVELALCADIRIADETARFGLPEIGWGFFPAGGGTQRLPRIVPAAVALEMVLTGEVVDAARAERIGLVNRVVPASTDVEAAIAMAERLASMAPLAVARAKEAVLRGREMALEDGLRLELSLLRTLQGTRDLAEGLAAFAERRTPQFEGR